MMFGNRYAINFAEVVDSHFGCQQIGHKAQRGFSLQELDSIHNKLKQANIASNLLKLHEHIPSNHRSGNEAAVLHIPNFINQIAFEGAVDKLYEEQEGVEYDRKFYDGRMKRTFNKRARYNIVFGDEDRKASEDYKVYTIKSMRSLKYLSLAKEEISRLVGPKGSNLHAEGNKYFEQKSGMGFHGDCERKIVICLSLGRSMKLRFHWRSPGSFKNSEQPIDIDLKHGDVYIMSEKATGNDWKKNSRYRLVHGVGSPKFIGK